jgi:hypothetical protein
LVLLMVTTLAVLALRRPGDKTSGATGGSQVSKTVAPIPEARTESTGPAASPTAARVTTHKASPTPKSSPSATPVTVTSVVPLTARYATSGSTSLLGYRASILITNANSAAISDWTVRLTFPLLSLSVTDVSGAVASNDGGTWTFTPNQSDAVPAGGTHKITFKVGGVTVSQQPSGCTIDGQACSGL